MKNKRAAIINGDVVKIPLTLGKEAFVNLQDYQKNELLQGDWFVLKSDIKFYAVKKYKGKRIFLHHIIMNTLQDVDHINGNSLDNRRENLRICSSQQNALNRDKIRPASSKYKGVSWSKSCKKWQVRINLNKKSYWLGRFTDEKEAANSYNEAAARLHRDFANLN